MQPHPQANDDPNSDTRFWSATAVGLSVFLYFALATETLFLETTAYAVLAAMLTNIAFKSKLIFIALAALAVTFIVIRSVRPDPKLPSGGLDGVERIAPEQQKVEVEDKTPAPPKLPESDDPLAAENRLTPNDSLLVRFEERDRPFLQRLLSGELGVIRDAAKLKTIREWIGLVRAAQEKMSARKAMMESLDSLSGAIKDPVVLLELGLLDGWSYHPPKTGHHPHEGPSEFSSGVSSADTVEVFKDGSSSATSLDDDGEPKQDKGPDAMVMLISPTCHGYIFLYPYEIAKMPAPPLHCDVVHRALTRYCDATNDTELMKSWLTFTSTPPHPASFFREINDGQELDLQRIEDSAIAGEVRGTSAQELASYYAAYESAIEEYEDYIAHQQRIAKFAEFTLTEAHKQVRAIESSERARRIAERASRVSSPWAYLSRDKTPLKTRAQRRLELEALVFAALPTTLRDW